jgi:hypothetical protein
MFRVDVEADCIGKKKTPQKNGRGVATICQYIDSFEDAAQERAGIQYSHCLRSLSARYSTILYVCIANVRVSRVGYLVRVIDLRGKIASASTCSFFF